MQDIMRQAGQRTEACRLVEVSGNWHHAARTQFGNACTAVGQGINPVARMQCSQRAQRDIAATNN